MNAWNPRVFVASCLAAIVALSGITTQNKREPVEAETSADRPHQHLSLDELIERMPENDRREFRPSESRPSYGCGMGLLHHDSGPYGWALSSRRPFHTELSRRIKDGVSLSDEQWARALKRTQLLVFRDKWPRNEPYVVWKQEPGWLSSFRVEILHFRMDLNSRDSFTSLEGTRSLLPPLAPDAATLSFAVIIHGKSEPLWSGELTYDVTQVASFDEVIPAIHGAVINQKIMSSVEVGFEEAEGKPPVAFLGWKDSHERCLEVSCNACLTTLPEEMTLVVRFDILKDGEVIENGYLTSYCNRRVLRSLIPTQSFEGWELRLTGEFDPHYFQWSHTSRWAGRITVPLAEKLARK